MSNTWRHFAKKAIYRIKFLTKNADFFPFVLSLSCATLGLCFWDTDRGWCCFAFAGSWMACKSIINFISIRCTWDFLIRPTSPAISLHNLPVNLFKMSTTTFFVFCSRLFNWMNVIIRQILKSKLELNFRFVETLYITVQIFNKKYEVVSAKLSFLCSVYASNGHCTPSKTIKVEQFYVISGCWAICHIFRRCWLMLLVVPCHRLNISRVPSSANTERVS